MHWSKVILASAFAVGGAMQAAAVVRITYTQTGVNSGASGTDIMIDLTASAPSAQYGGGAGSIISSTTFIASPNPSGYAAITSYRFKDISEGIEVSYGTLYASGGYFTGGEAYRLVIPGASLFTNGTITETVTASRNGAPIDVTGTFVISGVPEPANWAMMIVGLGLVGVAMRRQTARHGRPAPAAAA